MSSNWSAEALKAAHKHSFENRKEIDESTMCGCFYCMRLIVPKDVNWDMGNVDETGFCPLCGTDSVIGDASKLPVTDPSFLHAMYTFYFEKATPFPEK